MQVGDRVVVVSGGELGNRAGQEGVIDSIRGLAYRVEFPKMIVLGDAKVPDWDWFRRDQLRPPTEPAAEPPLALYREHLECERDLQIIQAEFERAQAKCQEASTAAVHARRAWENVRAGLPPDVLRSIVFDGRPSPPPLRKRTRLRQSARRGRPKDRQFTRKRDGKKR